MRPHAAGHEGAGIDRKSIGGTDQFSESPAPSQALRSPPPPRPRGTVSDTLADLRDACVVRTAALAGAFADPDVLADRNAIAAEGLPGGAP
jgi:hypothetical protein